MQENRLIGALLRVPFLTVVDRIYAGLVAAGYDDFTRPHLAVFRHIDETVGSRLIDLAEEAQISKQSMDYLVDHLEKCGYVTRSADPNDGRVKRIQLTARGQAAMSKAREITRKVEQEWAAALGAERMNELLSTLKDLTAMLEEQRYNERIHNL
jgi:DNA-binding MarR family transcriptional regulator